MNGPILIDLGTGRFAVGKFEASNGDHGLLILDTGVDHPENIGKYIKNPNMDGKPHSNECYIMFHNKESALVLLEQVARVVAAFTPDTL